MVQQQPIIAHPSSIHILSSTKNDGLLTGGVIIALIWLFIIFTVGVYLYEQYEGWSALDAVYFVTTTILTIGYGDFTPKTSEGKILTILIAWTGISVAFYMIYTIATYREKWFDRHIMHRLGRLHSIASERKKKQN